MAKKKEVEKEVAADESNYRMNVALKKPHVHGGKTFDVGTQINDIKCLTANDIAFMRSCGTI